MADALRAMNKLPGTTTVMELAEAFRHRVIRSAALSAAVGVAVRDERALPQALRKDARRPNTQRCRSRAPRSWTRRQLWTPRSLTCLGLTSGRSRAGVAIAVLDLLGPLRTLFLSAGHYRKPSGSLRTSGRYFHSHESNRVRGYRRIPNFMVVPPLRMSGTTRDLNEHLPVQFSGRRP